MLFFRRGGTFGAFNNFNKMKDEFSKEKKDFLNKKDKSTKGSWDKEILDLLNFINSLEDYYTTSSCSGRIVLISEQDKKESKWLFVSHSPVSELKINERCWFLQESPIIHIRCRSLESAAKLIDIACGVGLKKSGVISLSNITVEIRGNERIECPVDEKLSDEFVNRLVDEGNKKLLKSRKMFERFFEELENKLK